MEGFIPILGSDFGAGMIPAALNPVFDLDVTLFASYNGSGQTVESLVAVPSDGSTKAQNQFCLGATTTPSTDDPTPVGAAGTKTFYLQNDGADRLNIAGANTAFFDNLHKTTGGTPFWFATALQWATVASSTTIFGTTTSSAGAGIRLTSSSVNKFQFTQRGDTAQVSSNSAAWPDLANGTNYVMIVSSDGSTLRSWVNSRTKAEQAFAFNAGTAAPTVSFRTFNSLPNGARFYACAGGNRFIDNADAAILFNLYNKRHGRVYA